MTLLPSKPASDPPVTLFTGNECKPIVDRDDLISLGRWLASLLLYPWYRASISRTFHPNLPADSTRAIKTTDSRTAKTELIPIPGPGESFFPAFIQQSERILDKGLPASLSHLIAYWSYQQPILCSASEEARPLMPLNERPFGHAVER